MYTNIKCIGLRRKLYLTEGLRQIFWNYLLRGTTKHTGTLENVRSTYSKKRFENFNLWELNLLLEARWPVFQFKHFRASSALAL